MPQESGRRNYAMSSYSQKLKTGCAKMRAIPCMAKHPDKTFVGRAERGFDFLGYHFGPEGLTLAAKTIEQFAARAIRLYEHEPGEADASVRLGLYVRRWVRWAGAGVPGATSDCITTAEAGGPSQN